MLINDITVAQRVTLSIGKKCYWLSINLVLSTKSRLLFCDRREYKLLFPRSTIFRMGNTWLSHSDFHVTLASPIATSPTLTAFAFGSSVFDRL
jgi:hypothetical protein